MLATKPASAQTYPVGLKFLHPEILTVNEGLSQGLVSAITQDDLGFMWFGTLDGFNRYDGYNITVFRHEPGDSNSLSENHITSLFTDSKKRLWAGTATGGLNLFDYETERFVHFKHIKGLPSLSDDRILSIQEDANGAIWVGSKNGLNKITITARSEKNSTKNSIPSHSFFSSQQVIIKHIQFDNSGKEFFSNKFFDPSFFIDTRGIIFGETENGIFSILPSASMDDTIVKLDDLKPDEAVKTFLSNKAISQSGLEKDKLLYRMAKRFIAKIDLKTGIVNLIKYADTGISFRNNSIPITGENVWFEFNFHLYQYNSASHRVTEINSYEANEQLLTTSSINIFKDRTGMIWVGSSGYGVAKFNPFQEKFNRVKSLSVQSMYAGALDEILIKESNVFYRLQRNVLGKDSSNWQKNTGYFKEIYSKLNGKYLNRAVPDTKGNIWLQADGIRRFDLQTKHLETLVPYTVDYFFLDEAENQCWFFHGSSLSKINSLTLKETSFPIPIKTALQDFYVETIFKDAQNILWLGTTEGLFRFDERQQKWDQYSWRANDPTSMSSKFIFCICADKDPGYLWIGTNGGGFNRFNKKTGNCTRYNMNDGLPNNVVYGILSDDAGNLWMSTNRGLSNYNPVTKKFENYTLKDGLQGNEFNRHAYCKTKDGTMFFGGVNGFNYFNPAQIKNNKPVTARIIITDIKSSEKSIDFREKNSPLPMPAYLTKEVILDFTQNNISFDFSAMDFAAGASEEYQYMLEGIDKEWIFTSINHSAVYSNLQPGSYIFKVKEKNNTAGDNEAYTSITIIIQPPWYMTWWFRVLMIIFSATVLYSLFRYNLKQKIKRYREHQRIASDLHDEIGSTLSSVHIYSEVAQSKLKNNPIEAETYLKQISNNVETTIGALDDIVWALNAKNDRFEDIGNRMRAAAISICEASGYHLQLNFDEQLNDLKFGIETRKNLFLVYKEAINNVIKYAQGQNLFIDLSLTKKEIVLSVKDDGKGFIVNEKKNGNGLNNMQKRAKALNGNLQIISVPGQGTHIVLRFEIAVANRYS